VDRTSLGPRQEARNGWGGKHEDPIDGMLLEGMELVGRGRKGKGEKNRRRKRKRKEDGEEKMLLMILIDTLLGAK
jgi:hypothetical protein